VECEVKKWDKALWEWISRHSIGLSGWSRYQNTKSVRSEFFPLIFVWSHSILINHWASLKAQLVISLYISINFRKSRGHRARTFQPQIKVTFKLALWCLTGILYCKCMRKCNYFMRWQLHMNSYNAIWNKFGEKIM